MTVNSIVLCKRRQHLHAIVLGQHYDLTNCSRQKTNWNHSRSITLQCSVKFVHSLNVPYELKIFAAFSTNLFHNSHFIRVPKTYFRWGLFICLWKFLLFKQWLSHYAASLTHIRRASWWWSVLRLLTPSKMDNFHRNKIASQLHKCPLRCPSEINL